MARITVEDCLKHVKNRFVLVMLAAKRARQLMRGRADPTVPWENDKATVVALREIATGHTDFSDAYEMDNDKVETTTTVSDVFISTPTETPIEPDTALEEINNHSTDAVDSKDLEDSE